MSVRRGIVVGPPLENSRGGEVYKRPARFSNEPNG
jgi:hypothetical protein